jgi:hypothetical protein
MKDEYAVYYSRCPNSGHFVLFHPEQIALEYASVPDALDAHCPVCKRTVRLVGLRKGWVALEDRERMWALKKPRENKTIT